MVISFFFSVPGHHIHELSEVHRAGVVLVHFGDDLLQVWLGEVRVDLPEYLLQNISADVALLVFVVNPTVMIIWEECFNLHLICWEQ